MGEVLTCRMAQVLWASNETQIPFVHSLSVRGGPRKGNTVVDLMGAALDAFQVGKVPYYMCSLIQLPIQTSI